MFLTGPYKVNWACDHQMQPQFASLRDRYGHGLRSCLKKIKLLWRVACGTQSRDIPAHLRSNLQVFQRLLENARSGAIFRHDEAIMHPLAFAPRRDDSCSAKVS